MRHRNMRPRNTKVEESFYGINNDTTTKQKVLETNSLKLI